METFTHVYTKLNSLFQGELAELDKIRRSMKKERELMGQSQRKEVFTDDESENSPLSLD